MTYYSDYQRTATLQEIADNLCTDKEVEYLKAGKLIGAVEPIDLTGYSSFFVKLKAYIYEFEIGDDIQIASINVSGEPGVDGSGRSDPALQVISGPKAGGAYNNPYIPTGFTHKVGDGTWNSGYTIVESATGNEFVWVPCIVKDGVTSNQIETMENGDKVITFGKTFQSPYNLNRTDMTISDNTEFPGALIASVSTYQGFYIAKYEAGVPLDENGAEITTNLNTAETAAKKARSFSDATVWSAVSRVNAIIAASNMIEYSSTGVKSCLITGECWDTTLQWIENTSDNKDHEPNKGFASCSGGKGLNNNAGATRVAGASNVINNIYSMGGNYREWTTEYCYMNDGQTFEIYRAAAFDDNPELGWNAPAERQWSKVGAAYGEFRF